MKLKLKHLAGAAFSVGLLAAGVGLGLTSTQALAQQGSAAATAPITKGQTYVMATHSFNVFVGPGREGDPGPLGRLAAEAGITGHQNLAVQMIGGSTPMQHWNQGAGDDSKNIAKVALAKGGVDVFTMSPNATMPETGIDNFGDLVIKTNPQARIMVQSSWSAWDGKGSTASVGGTGAPVGFTNADHDTATVEIIDGWRKSLNAPGGYLVRLRTQLEGIDKRAGREITYVVPSADAVYALRQLIAQGKVPGVAKQSEIFRDAMGHPNILLNHQVSYVWFAAMYRRSPVGLKALVDPANPNSAKQELLMQQIAWNAVLAEPKSGVKGRPVTLTVASN